MADTTASPGTQLNSDKRGDFSQSLEKNRKLKTGVSAEYGGVFTGTITAINSDGTATLIANSNLPDGTNVVRASLNKISGGNREVSGINAPPSVGAACVFAYLGAQASPVGSAIILTYINPGKAGSSGLKPGDILLATDRGLKLSLDNEKNTIELTDVNKFGMTVINNTLSLYSKSFKLQNFDTGATQLIFNNDATITYETTLNSIRVKSKNYVQETAQNFKSSVTGMREDTTVGEHTIKAGNLINNAVHQVSVIAGEKIFVSTTGDIDHVSDANLTTTTGDNVRGSLTGKIVDFVQVGSITLAAGTAATTGTAQKAGIPVAAASILIDTKSKIVIDNILSTTTHSIGGIISTSAMKYFLSSKGIVSIEAIGAVTASAKGMLTLDAIGKIGISTKALMAIDAVGMMTISTKAIMTISSSLAMEIKATAMKLSPTIPIAGVKVITMFGPMPIIPG